MAAIFRTLPAFNLQGLKLYLLFYRRLVFVDVILGLIVMLTVIAKAVTTNLVFDLLSIRGIVAGERDENV